MINHIKVICICVLSLLLCSIETHAVRGGFGGGIGESSQDKNWTEDPAGIFGKSEVNINVGDTTTIIGGAIVSETEGGLNLVTDKLEMHNYGSFNFNNAAWIQL